jgi:hypothetical protein
MSEVLTSGWLNAPGSEGLGVWLASSGYARRLLLGEGGNPFASASQYLTFFTQADGLLRPDVAVLDLGEFYRSWVEGHPGLALEMASKRRATYPLRRLLDEPEPRRLMREIVEAVLAALHGRKPFVVALPSPKAWLTQAARLADLGDPDAAPEAVDDAAMYVADLLRPLSSLPVSGMLLEEDGDGEAMGDESVQSYQPLVNIARHYRWSIRLRLGPQSVAGPGTLSSFDGVIAPPGTAVDKLAGLDVGAALWAGEALPALDPGQFYYARVPPDHEPEAVLETLARLRGNVLCSEL